MRWKWFGVACALALFGLPVAAQTVDEIIAKSTAARGGLDKIKTVQSIRTSGKVRFGDFRAAFVLENKRPDKVREEFIIQGMTQVWAYDGKTGWEVSPFGGRLVKHARYYWLLLAESHLTRRLFGAMVRRIELLPLPAG